MSADYDEVKKLRADVKYIRETLIRFRMQCTAQQVFMIDQLISVCASHVTDSSDEWNEKRMDIIGQNGNDGSHY